MKHILFILIFFLFYKANAQQNLVPNSSFDVSNFIVDSLNPPYPTFDSCLFYTSTTYFAPPWRDIPIATAFWSFNTCSYFDDARLPLNKWGFQNPHSGESVGGLGTYSHSQYSNGGYFCRNYPFVKLKNTLKNNKTYCVEFFVNLEDSNSTACNDIGAYFSIDSITSGQIDLLNQTIFPQINNDPLNNPLTSRTDWMRVHGNFVANGTENYITIGNFKSQSQLDTTHLSSPPLHYTHTYLYLDDVSVIELRANAFADDTLICSNTGFTKKLRVFDGMHNVLWSTGDTSQSITVNQAGVYWVTASNECGTVTDSIKIRVVNPDAYKINLGIDALFCTTFSKQINIINPNLHNIVWSNNDTLPSLTITQPGIYWATAQSECGLQTDTIVIIQENLPSNIIIQNDTSIFVGDNLTIKAIDGLQQYNWSNGENSQTISISSTVNGGAWEGYLTAFTTNGCEVKDSLKITFKEKPSFEKPIIVPNPQYIQKNTPLQILNLPDNSKVYLYNSLGQLVINNSFNLELEFTGTAIYYYLIILNDGSIIKDKVLLIKY